MFYLQKYWVFSFLFLFLLFLLLFLIIIFIMAMCDFLRCLGEEVGRFDLTDGTGQLVPLVVGIFEIHRGAIARGHRRLLLIDVDVRVLYCGLVWHLHVEQREEVTRGVSVPGCLPETHGEQAPECNHWVCSLSNATKPSKVLLRPVEIIMDKSTGTFGTPARFPGITTHQNVGSSEEVAEGVVEEVDEGGCIEVSVAHHLAGKQCLPRAAAEEAPHHPVAHIHVVGHFL